MNEIVAVGDVHEGINFGFGLDPITGVSERALDLHGNLTKAAEFALENSSRLFIVLGDLFDRPNVGPVFREMVRRDVVEPLGRAGTEVWLVAGNHDQPRNMARGTSLDDFRGYPHVKVFRTPTVQKVDISGRSVGFVIVPYLHPENIAIRVREELGKDIPQEEVFHSARAVLKEWIRKRVEELDTDTKVLLGHYYIEGAQLSNISYEQYLPGEFAFSRDMLPESLDLVVFGHMHIHQLVCERPPTVYAGAVERIDWGERSDPKGFISIDASAEWRFNRLDVRDMLRIRVDVSGERDPNRKLFDAIPADCAGKMIILEIVGEEGIKGKIDEKRLSERSKDAFYFGVSWRTQSAEKAGFVEFSMDPVTLFRRFVEINFARNPSLKRILEEGEEILKEVLS